MHIAHVLQKLHFFFPQFFQNDLWTYHKKFTSIYHKRNIHYLTNFLDTINIFRVPSIPTCRPPKMIRAEDPDGLGWKTRIDTLVDSLG